jgi:exo-beta-1,3-glucanase (GH17 family)/cellulose synthase/poly-beta-1,6-N-acetylglucosamine synthase-like glycosyltransferase
MPRRIIPLLPALFTVLALSAITLAGWAIANRPYLEPAWPGHVAGYAYSPYRAGQSPLEGTHPSREEIRADLALLSQQTRRIRTYAVDDVLADIPQIAREFGMQVTIGAWLTRDFFANAMQIEKLIAVANTNPNVDRVIVGNETLLREDLSPEQLIAYVHYVKSRVKVPVSTAEPWHLWNANRPLADACDFIAAHFLPYWQGKQLVEANDHIASMHYALTQSFPGKPILLAEVGWPSRGREVGDADATVADEARFLRNFLPMAEDLKLDYFIMEAFDQPWKQANEGSVGAYWGVWDVDREEKFPFSRPIVEIPEWRMLVSIAIALAVLTFLLLLSDARLLRTRAVSFLAVVAFATTTTLVWMANAYMEQYATVGTILLGIVLAISAMGVTVVLLVEAHEWAEAAWSRRRRPFAPVTEPAARSEARVSIHVPCYNEPPEMVIATLDALAALHYANYEVLLIDNNTRDENVWRPVEAHCRKLGERFRFFHVAPLAGYKAGALNYGIGQTARDADIIAVIDSDYQVSPDWLTHLVPHFDRPEVAIVQAPQDYRDGDENAFKAMCYAEYRGFFHIGMVTRNDRNAIIQHGTMTMVRRQVLEDVGGWAEWCVAEDAELGLRVFEAGHEAVYVAHSYGKGLIPDNCVDYQKQRFRWAFGAMQILRAHAETLFFGRNADGGPTALKLGQRYHFIGGWLPWIADGFNLLFTAGAILWSLAMILLPNRVDPPLAVFAIPPIALFFFKWAKLWFLYRSHIGIDRRTTLAAAFAGLALSYTIATAVLYGLVRRAMPFLRTPKLKARASIWSALRLARDELLLLLVLSGCFTGIVCVQDAGTSDVRFWLFTLAIQAIPYAAAVYMALASARSRS